MGASAGFGRDQPLDHREHAAGMLDDAAGRSPTSGLVFGEHCFSMT
jgi:hypothetical protein